MNKKYMIILLFISNIFAQTSTNVTLKTKTGNIEGTLLVPNNNKNIPVALIIAGSGPTDRDGNNPVMKNNSLKMLAEGLNKNGIASLRFDKRGIARSKTAGYNEVDLRFEFYINDVLNWIDYLKKEKGFKKIIVIGHSEGSLIGMVASQNKNVEKFISIAGAGLPASDILRKQLKSQPKAILDDSLPIISQLESGHTVDNIPPILNSLFRPSVQPYMISWFKYNPQAEIAKLDIPVLIIQGTTDLQVSVDDADKLSSANPKAEKHIIKGMNHVLKEAEPDRVKNFQTYNNPVLPLMSGVVDLIVEFIK